MSRDCQVVDSKINIRSFAEDYLLRTGRRCFTVLQNGRQLGLATIDDLKHIARNRWPFMTLTDIAHPLDQLTSVSPETPMPQVLDVMARQDLNELPVISNGELVGVISRGDVFRLMQTRQELKAA